MTKSNAPHNPPQYIYLMTNPAFPDFVKMGYSDDPWERQKQLYNTSVPDPFVLQCVVKVHDMREAEKSFHLIHYKSRHRKTREFFALELKAATLTIKLLGKDVTKKFTEQKRPLSPGATRKTVRKKKAKTRNMFHVGLKKGDTLVATFGRGIAEFTAVVATEGEVIFQGERLSLSEAALKAQHSYAAQHETNPWPTINGWDYWKFKGQTLSAWRDADGIDRPN